MCTCIWSSSRMGGGSRATLKISVWLGVDMIGD